MEQAEAERQERERKEREKQEREKRGILLIEYFDQYIESRRDEVTAGQLTGKTFSRYENARARLIAYMKSKYKCSDIPMKQIDLFFIKNFEMYLRTHFKCGNNTVMKIVQKLGTVVTLAHDTGLLPTNPFRLYHFHFEETERDILTLDELDYLYNYQFTCPKLEQVRDTYIFSCYTGLAYTDTDKLDIQNIKDFFDGNDWIIKRREKTNVESKILLLDIPRQILKKYEGKLSKGQLLPVISNQKTNDYLKEIAAITGIDKRLTFHTGIDMPKTKGTPVYAAGSGVVVRKGYNSGYGNFIEIQHASGFRSFYAHLSKTLVNVGDSVSMGKYIACVGNSGLTIGCHLHYEIRKGNRFLNPIEWCCCLHDVLKFR